MLNILQETEKKIKTGKINRFLICANRNVALQQDRVIVCYMTKYIVL